MKTSADLKAGVWCHDIGCKGECYDCIEFGNPLFERFHV